MTRFHLFRERAERMQRVLTGETRPADPIETSAATAADLVAPSVHASEEHRAATRAAILREFQRNQARSGPVRPRRAERAPAIHLIEVGNVDNGQSVFLADPEPIPEERAARAAARAMRVAAREHAADER